VISPHPTGSLPIIYSSEFLSRSFKDINGDGLADYCRFVGNIPREAESCNLATPSGFSPNQYHIKPSE
jgi:hypothetical protein